MRNIHDCVEAFLPLLDTEYELVLGRKGAAVTIRIAFDKRDCYHLMGFQYLTDRPELNRDRGKIYEAILERRITSQQVESSEFYSRIEDRIYFLPLLEQIFDDNETIFKFNRNLNSYSKIQADYLMKNHMEDRNLFLFLSKSKESKYFCRSFFPQNERDYTKNQPSWTVLSKKKIWISTGKGIILYDHMRKGVRSPALRTPF